MQKNITNLIAGPEHVEREMTRLLGIDNTAGRNLFDYLHFIKYLQGIKPHKRQSFVHNFLLAYFHQQAGNHCSDQNQRKEHFKLAFSNYVSYLDSPEKHQPDTKYFSQWQIGKIQESFSHPWPAVEQSYLTTLEYDVSRAEALKAILTYHLSRDHWRVAYIYSSYCMNNFLGKRPLKRCWSVDNDFYDWKILIFHIRILLALGEKQQAQLLLDTSSHEFQGKPQSLDQYNEWAINVLNVDLNIA